jgi:Fe-S-cluster containining protein
MSKLEWYKEGLHFECTQCGKCCTGGPGAVWIESNQAEKISSFLKITVEAFYSYYCKKVGNRWTLVEKTLSYDCIFLKGKQCTIYSVRPLQCQTFPFWPGALTSQESWNDTALYCEGIHEKAAKVDYETIQKIKSSHED